jgi:DNA-binding IclR family transcriptional regulator
MDESRPGRVASVAKAAALLAAFSPRMPVVSLRELSRRTGIPRSTVHGLCLSLCDGGLLEEVPGRGYQLGPGLIALGGQVIARTGLVAAGEEVLELAARIDGTWVLLGQLVDGWIVFLDRRTAERHGPVSMRLGARAPVHRTGCGKAALSLLDEAEVTERVELACAAGRLSPPSMPDLLRQLAEARQRGYAINTDWRPDRVSVAAPVVDRRDAVVGAVSVAGPVHLFSSSAIAQAARDVMSVAARIGERLP